MLGLKIEGQHAQVVREYLQQHDLQDITYKTLSENEFVIFPVVREFSPPWEFEADFVDVELDANERTGSLKDELKEHLNQGELDDLITAFDIVGSIAIIEVPDTLVSKEQLIARKLMAANKTVKTVLKKSGGHEGEFRTQQMEYIAGEDTRETEVTENGVRLKINVESAYYSVRMSTERKRILELIKPGENILCLFSGVGPYPIQFSKHSEAGDILGIEINPVAHELSLENVAMNRCTNVRLIEGDVHTVLPKLAADNQTFDRVTMPLPHTAADFLDDVLSVSKPGMVIHFYTFQHENEFEKGVDTVKTAFRRKGKSLGNYTVVKAGQHAPRIFRLCIDAEVE